MSRSDGPVQCEKLNTSVERAATTVVWVIDAALE